MIIIRVQGGMGNQLFQYALYKELEKAGKIVKVDLVTYGKSDEPRNYRLEEVFGLQLSIATPEEVFHMAGGEKNLYQKVVRKFFKRKNWYKETAGISLEEIKKLDKGYLSGYWQSTEWFPSVMDELRNELQFRDMDEEFCSKCAMIAKENSVSIHVRMGDYLQNEAMYGGICTKDYYRSAIEYIHDHVKKPIYYVFSDEPDKARLLLQDMVDAYYVENREEEKDMMMISSCRHNILANSSFSWWGTFLNQHADKIVVSPSKWNNIENYEKIMMKEWIKI